MDEVSTTKPQRDEGTPLECLSQRKDKSVLVRDGYQFVPMPELIITRLHGRDLLAEPPPKKAFEKKKEQKGKQG